MPGKRAFLKFVREDKHALWQKITDSRELDADAAAKWSRPSPSSRVRYSNRHRPVRRRRC